MALERVRDDPSLIVPHFQAIVDLNRGIVAGFEMLARFGLPGGERPAPWFDAAARLGMIEVLDASMLRAAIERLGDLPLNTFLTVNLTPLGACSQQVREAVAGSDGLGPLVIELTEQTEAVRPADLVDFATLVRRRGGMVAIDDVGAGYGSLQRVMGIRPEFVKIDRSFVSALHVDEAKAATVEMMGTLADRIDAWIVAEGVETVAELDRLAGMRIPLAQGFLFARPEAEMSTALTPELARRMELLARPRDCGLEALLEDVAPLHESLAEAAAAEAFAADPALEHIPVVDRRRRPVGLLARPFAEGAPPLRLSALSVYPNAEITAVARRAMTRPRADRFAPVAYCDEQGRYIGLVRIERLIGALAVADQPSSRP